MRRTLYIGAAATLATLLAVQAIHAAGLLPAHEQRLEHAQTRHAQQLETAARAYHAAVERANATLERNYERAIGYYESRDDDATVQALRSELDELIATATNTMPPAPTPARTSRADGHTELIQAIGPALLNANGEKVPSSVLAGKDHVMLFFSASWCGPCRRFTPSLVELHNQYAESGNFEVVLVGSDRSADAMVKYMSDYDMPWLAVPFDRIRPSELRSAYGGRGIPGLAIVDPDGEAVSRSHPPDGDRRGANRVLADMRQILAQ